MWHILYKSDIKCQIYPRLPRPVFVHRVETETVWTVKQSRDLSLIQEALTKVFCTLGSKVIVPAEMGHFMAQTSSWHTDRRTDAGNDNTRRPKMALGNDIKCTDGDKLNSVKG